MGESGSNRDLPLCGCGGVRHLGPDLLSGAKAHPECARADGGLHRAHLHAVGERPKLKLSALL